MVTRYGKLFKNLSTGSICYFSYDRNNDYYAFIQEMLRQGYRQCIITSDIMIKIIEHYVLSGNTEVISIDFMIEEDELKKDISHLLELMKNNLGYWVVLKKRLSFLSKKDSIEIKKVSFRLKKGSGSLFKIYANGIIAVSEVTFDDVLESISKIMEGYVK